MGKVTRCELYRHYDARGLLLYVGVSASALIRLATHANAASWFGQITRVEIERYETPEDAVKAEGAVIQSEKPKHNKIVSTAYSKAGRPLDSEKDKTLAALKPWVALGMSRRTWYRRQKIGNGT